MVGRSLAGFIISRRVLEEAEILSVAVAASRRGKGLARQLLDLHLRRLAGLGARTVFLESSGRYSAIFRDTPPTTRLSSSSSRRSESTAF